MRLYVLRGKKKIYLRTSARTRKELYRKIGKRYFYIANRRYAIQDVHAINDRSDVTAGVLVGGLIGLVAGPIGVITGGTLGGLIGNSNESLEAKRVKIFNESNV